MSNEERREGMVKTRLETSQYGKKDEIQPIDLIKSMGDMESFCRGNAIKYLARYFRKNGLEDLRKAETYVRWLVEYVEQQQGQSAKESMLKTIRKDQEDLAQRMEESGLGFVEVAERDPLVVKYGEVINAFAATVEPAIVNPKEGIIERKDFSQFESGPLTQEMLDEQMQKLQDPATFRRRPMDPVSQQISDKIDRVMIDAVRETKDLPPIDWHARVNTPGTDPYYHPAQGSIAVSVDPENYKCSACNKPTLSLECEHFPGQELADGTVVRGIVRQFEDVRSVSPIIHPMTHPENGLGYALNLLPIDSLTSAIFVPPGVSKTLSTEEAKEWVKSDEGRQKLAQARRDAEATIKQSKPRKPTLREIRQRGAEAMAKKTIGKPFYGSDPDEDPAAKVIGKVFDAKVTDGKVQASVYVKDDDCDILGPETVRMHKDETVLTPMTRKIISQLCKETGKTWDQCRRTVLSVVASCDVFDENEIYTMAGRLISCAGDWLRE